MTDIEIKSVKFVPGTVDAHYKIDITFTDGKSLSLDAFGYIDGLPGAFSFYDADSRQIFYPWVIIRCLTIKDLSD